MNAPVRRTLIDDFIDDGEETAPWMVTYGDMMTLLLVFFILLYTVFYFQTESFKRDLSKVEIEVDDRGTTMNVLEYAQTLGESARPVVLEEATGLREKRARMLSELRELADAENWGHDVSVQSIGDKVVVTLDGSAVFGSGSAGLTEGASAIFERMVETFERYPDYRVGISGHTDDVPISNQRFSSNWELSAVRATSVLRYFAARGIDPRRLTATGYADLFPVAPNDDEQGRSRNRRVEFVLEKESR